MTKGLAAWFAELEPPASMPEAPHQHGRREAAFCCPKNALSTAADALALPWCTDEPEELTEPLHGSESATDTELPLLCSACRLLVLGRCGAAGGGLKPDAEQAARCRDFCPNTGVTIGRVWLWRVEMVGGRLVWWTCLPEISQREAINRVRATYGDAVRSVTPLPGFVAFPCVTNTP